MLQVDSYQPSELSAIKKIDVMSWVKDVEVIWMLYIILKSNKFDNLYVDSNYL